MVLATKCGGGGRVGGGSIGLQRSAYRAPCVKGKRVLNKVACTVVA